VSWTQPAQPGDPDSGDYIAFDRVYRDGQRLDTTGFGDGSGWFPDGSSVSALASTWIDAHPPSGQHTYYLTTVDTHEAESSASASVTC
jgi:hypothetical protein